jgi:septal ring factor EnvC (AmiA/AmiB activator)
LPVSRKDELTRFPCGKLNQCQKLASLTVFVPCTSQAEVLIAHFEAFLVVKVTVKKEGIMSHKKMTTATFVFASMFMLGMPLMAAETKKDIKNEIKADKKEIRSDKKELRSDRKELRRDRKELREARQEGASKDTIQSLKNEIKQDKKEIAADKKDLKSDRKELRSDRKDYGKAK